MLCSVEWFRRWLNLYKGLTDVLTYEITNFGKTFYFYKVGKIVWLDAPYDITSGNAGNNIVGTIPSWLRPLRLIRFPIANATTSGFAQLDTSGQLLVYRATAVTSATNCSIAGVYIAAE